MIALNSKASDLLKKPYWLMKKIEEQQNILKDLRVCYSGPNINSTGGHSSGSDERMITLINKIDEKENYILDLKKTHMELMELIEDILEKLDDVERKVLVDWYLLRKPKKEVVRELGYSEAQMWRIKKRALINFEKIMKDDSE